VIKVRDLQDFRAVPVHSRQAESRARPRLQPAPQPEHHLDKGRTEELCPGEIQYDPRRIRFGGLQQDFGHTCNLTLADFFKLGTEDHNGHAILTDDFRSIGHRGHASGHWHSGRLRGNFARVSSYPRPAWCQFRLILRPVPARAAAKCF
jgi:hypothetical protein